MILDLTHSSRRELPGHKHALLLMIRIVPIDH